MTNSVFKFLFCTKIIIDCTGDGDVCAKAGAEFEIGENNNRVVQPCTFNAIISVKDVNDFAFKTTSFRRVGMPDDPLKGHTQMVKQNLEELQKLGIDPSYHHPTLFHIGGNMLLLMYNHEYDVHVDNEKEITQATIRTRKELNKIMNALESAGGIWKDAKIVASAEQIGIREGRRVKGLYTVSIEDAIAGKRHADSVCTATFAVDLHATSHVKNKTKTISNIRVKPYDIPLRALVCHNVDNLMMAGRCISGDRIVHGSYRVTGNAVQMGNGAGKAAADFIKCGISPHSLKA